MAIGEPRTTLKRSRTSRALWLLPVVAVIALLAFLFWRKSPTQPPPVEPPAVAEPGAIPEPPVAPSRPPPLMEASPAEVRSLLEPAAKAGSWKSWLNQKDLVRRWAVVTDNLAEGASPRRQLSFLAPRGDFAVMDKAGEKVIDPVTYRRYDTFADTVSNLDAETLARAYGALRGVIEVAYRALGYPTAQLDAVTLKALRRVEHAPLLVGDVPVVPARVGFQFADPRLEALPDVEKHLLRMGPRNAKLLQDKARELEAALKLGK